MLQIKGISKQYRTGELVQQALNDVSLNLRDNEFVSILGPSGSGKTTLLNVIGGLDRYDTGELVINGISTREYKDRDWDAYRNHTIGFVFQSYNLIPHQTILANVELALTIGGISRNDRRERARKALEEVGLGDQLHKKPNQMSGGQMQRVAIARALVNDPEVLLADEPTGALDSETSIQVMELLKKVAENRLVVMVTHNSELAEQYSTRIVKLRDGRVINDSDPYLPEETPEGTEHKSMGKAKMSFFTSLSLSFNNLWTKKGRTILTAFAGSIGIIGIALILALAEGVNDYISDIQKSTMASYPITINSQSVDMSGIMGTRGGRRENEASAEENRTRVYADYSTIESSEEMASNIKENNLTAFKEYLDNPESEIHQYLGENGVVYSYGAHFGIYSHDADENLVASNADIDQVSMSTLSSEDSAAGGGPMANMERMNQVMSGSSDAGAENFSELMPGTDGKAVSTILFDSYDLLYGSWPENYNEVVLVLNENNSIPAGTLYQLGLITGEEHKEITEQIKNGEDAEERIWDYEEICGHTFYMVLPCDQYKENKDGMFTYIGDDVMQIESLLENSVNLKITGIIRPAVDAESASIPTSVAYTVALTDYVIEHTDESAVVLAQEKTPEVNVLNGIEFKAPDDEAKAADAVIYMSNLGISDKAAMYANILAHQETDESEDQEHIEAMQGAPSMSPSEMAAMEGVERTEEDEIAMARALDEWLGNNPDQETLVSAYDIFIAGPTYEENMRKFGKVSYDAPSSISIYTDSFEDKEAVSDCIDRYNEGAQKKEQITYTDYVALLTSSITSIVDVISYVLIAFVAVSLIVSSIMIGIITHISVLERIKEIGILRAIGASKRNISQVFNAETVIVGLLAGILGVGVSVLLTIPITSVIQNLLGVSEISASLPVTAALLLILLSVAITVIAGWIPSRRAAKKDPVAALRTE
ncbi:ATP-binding cassette domain-containing protein [Parablautia intestinalis]|uniref:ATP-binding cassette domain-containing protein n=1 Tax=Parablautia intestinalis TaxID=2320100 RepID=A0A3A9AI57_9FIRM|nr:ABC transporter ATP-binding protein/permease [Parablautia intestinalis]RKI91067.1 ATP-binding cassette domain-containing protein [Parablautia intestinalis]